ncbi:MAG: MoaD/ThiS family protein [Stellaceae bacterium]
MPTVTFTAALQRFLDQPRVRVEGSTVGAALQSVFAVRPALKGYLLDDQGAVRRHVAIYLNGAPVKDRLRLGDPTGPADEIFVVQALTGG